MSETRQELPTATDAHWLSEAEQSIDRAYSAWVILGYLLPIVYGMWGIRARAEEPGGRVEGLSPLSPIVALIYREARHVLVSELHAGGYGDTPLYAAACGLPEDISGTAVEAVQVFYMACVRPYEREIEEYWQQINTRNLDLCPRSLRLCRKGLVDLWFDEPNEYGYQPEHAEPPEACQHCTRIALEDLRDVEIGAPEYAGPVMAKLSELYAALWESGTGQDDAAHAIREQITRERKRRPSARRFPTTGAFIRAARNAYVGLSEYPRQEKLAELLECDPRQIREWLAEAGMTWDELRDIIRPEDKS